MSFPAARRPLSSLLLAGAVAACSNQQLYTAVQERERQECAKLPQVQYEECMREIEGNYDDYAREREELKRDKRSGEPYQ
ncbi:MAG: hypothetical protein HKN19_00155 [Halioglobus sp.]|nr:hypothetical protein [Halioglobus sp.]